MIREFSFSWNGHRWNGYFNVIAGEVVIAHFEDAHMRDMLGQSLAYSKTETGAVVHAIDADIQQSHAGIYEAVRQGVELRLGRPLQHYLN